MPHAVVISPLARHREHLPLLTTWFRGQWPAWYGPGGPGDAELDLAAFASSEAQLPVGLLLLEDGEPAGVGALKIESLPSHRHLTPWAAAGFVLPSHRGRGLGALLLRALVQHAGRLGYETLYCATATAVNLLCRNGWSQTEHIEHEGSRLLIFRCSTA